MGFVAFVGRVLFAAVFVLSAYQEYIEFGVDGGPAAKAFKPKFEHFRTTYLGLESPHIEIKHIMTAMIALKGIGGLLFICSSCFGAYLLLIHLAFVTPIVYDFYNYDMDTPEFFQLFGKFTQNLALFGALLFFVGMKDSSARRHQRKKPVKSKAQ